jgi:hypothetical protein
MKRNIIVSHPPAQTSRVSLLLVLLLFFFMGPVIQSQAQIRWIATGAAPKYWSDPANWSGGVVPAGGDNVLFDASGTTVCTLTADVTVDRLTMNGFTSAIDLNGFDLQVSGTTGGVSLTTGSVISSAPSSELKIGTTLSPVAGITEFGGTTVGSAAQSVNVICFTQRVRIGSFFTSSGSSFYGSVMIEKTAATFDACYGRCIFYDALRLVLRSSASGLNTQGGNAYYGTVDIENNGVGSVSLDDDVNSVYYANVSLKCTGGGSIFIGRALSGTPATPTLLKGDVSLNTTNSSGIFFGSTTGYVILESGKSVTTSGFNSNELSFDNFTQTGSTPQNFVLGGDAYLRFNGGTIFNGPVTATAPGIVVGGVTFNDAASLTFTGGSGAPTSPGGASFYGNTVLKITGGTWQLGTTAGTTDTFFGNVTFERTAGTLQPANRNTMVVKGNMTVTSAGNITFGASATVSPRLVRIDGAGDQQISSTSTGMPVFRDLTIDKPSGLVNLTGSFTITSQLNFVKGIVVGASAADKVVFNDNATCSGANDLSYVDGIVRKIGNDVFVFPVGDNDAYKPIELTGAPSIATEIFEAQYFFQSTPHRTSVVAPLRFVNGLEYWTLVHTSGTSAVPIAIPWNTTDTPGLVIGNIADLSIAISSGTSWSSNAGTASGTTSVGKIILDTPVSSFGSYVTLGSKSFESPLPITLDFFHGTVENDHRVRLQWQTSEEINAHVFVIQRAINSFSFISVDTIEAYGNSTSPRQYAWKDSEPIDGTGYYRLMQIDTNGESEIFEAISFVHEGGPFRIWPNPARLSDHIFFSEKATVWIHDTDGRLRAYYPEISSLTLRDIEPWIYFFRVNGVLVYKVIVH